MIYIKWLCILPLSIVLELFCYTTNPIAAILTTELDGEDWLIFRWWQTHDNPADEYFRGGYYINSIFPYVRNMTAQKYIDSWFAQYVMRLMWMYRNNAYVFLYNICGTKDYPETEVEYGGTGREGYTKNWWVFRQRNGSFQLQWTPTIFPGYYTSINVG